MIYGNEEVQIVDGELGYNRSVFYQAENGIRDVERSRGLGDVYKNQH